MFINYILGMSRVSKSRVSSTRGVLYQMDAVQIDATGFHPVQKGMYNIDVFHLDVFHLDDIENIFK